MAAEPRLIVFACTWCSYPAADLAGTSRLRYPAGVRLIRVMCSGMVHPRLILAAFQAGADGVLVTGCREGECHYLSGNRQAQARAAAVAEALAAMGLEPERLGVFFCSSAEADRLANALRAMVERLAGLGPSPLRPGWTGEGG
jgi:F420-non-reducing hydrogenase iron-sulfur subunit